MRAFILPIAAMLVLSPAAFAQQTSGTTGESVNPPPAAVVSPSPIAAGTAPLAGNAPEAGSPLFPASDTGLDKVANDGISTKTVRAAPCGTAARETDGTTTCVGIPGPVAREGTTTGQH
jgi:hypothetical protein